MGTIRFKSCIASSYNSFDGSRTFFCLDAVLSEAARSYSGTGRISSVRLGSTYSFESCGTAGGVERMTYVIGSVEGEGDVVLGITDFCARMGAIG